MKSKILKFGCVVLAILCFMSCSSDNDNTPQPSPEPETDYVIMLYGCGGGNLDQWLKYNLEQLECYGYSSKVRFTGLVKYSCKLQGDVDTEGTRLYNMTENGLTNEKVYDSQ